MKPGQRPWLIIKDDEPLRGERFGNRGSRPQRYDPLEKQTRSGARLKCMKLLMLFLLLFQNPKPEIRIADLEQKIHQLVNFERKAADRPPFEWDDELSKIARAHSEDMVKRKYFKHVNPEGLTPMKRAEAAGYRRVPVDGREHLSEQFVLAGDH